MKKILLYFMYLGISLSCIYAQEAADTNTIVVEEMGKHGTIRFAVTIGDDLRVQNVEVVEMKEVKGEAIKKEKFLKQFIGRGPEDPVRIGKDIDAVTGATISSKAAAKAVRKALEISLTKEAE